MADKAFKLEVITPDRVVLSDKTVVSVVLPGSEGYLGVLGNHAPLVTELTIGEIDLRRADGTNDAMAVGGGFVEVLDNSVVVLADSAELRSEIDIERAEQALHRAEERLAARPPDLDVERVDIALKRALNRLDVARQRHS